MQNYSFSLNVKKEIIKHNYSLEEQKIISLSFLGLNSKITNNVLSLSSSLPKKYLEIIGNFFQTIKPTKIKILEGIKINKIIIEDEEFIELFEEGFKNIKLDSQIKYKSFIIGSFIAKGWINNPNSKNYHFEMLVKDLGLAMNILEVFDSLGIKTKILFKNDNNLIYVKNSSIISDILRSLNAIKSLLFFEDIKIKRDISSSFLKSEKIEEINIIKTQEASEKVINKINFLIKENTFKFLDKKIQDIAYLRKDYKDVSLNDLAYLYNMKNNTNYSKSTINNWLHKIMIL